jgi:hypothetical protein
MQTPGDGLSYLLFDFLLGLFFALVIAPAVCRALMVYRVNPTLPPGETFSYFFYGPLGAIKLVAHFRERAPRSALPIIFWAPYVAFLLVLLLSVAIRAWDYVS